MVDSGIPSTGTKIANIDVRLSYKIVKLFSEGFYTSPSKAIEELVANSFDAGSRNVHVLLSPNLHDQNAAIAVIDDGEGMDVEGLKQHWLIGISNKRNLAKLPEGRQQIGKFGIGKLATYVLANRLTHISKRNGKYYSTSMNYQRIDRHVNRDVEPKAPIKIVLNRLTDSEAQEIVKSWSKSAKLNIPTDALFGKGSSESWTICIMSVLKDKSHQIKRGRLSWILSTALPLRDDFAIWLNEEKLKSSKAGKGVLKSFIIGKNLVKFDYRGLGDITESKNERIPKNDKHYFGLDVPDLGRITGYAEAYKDLLTGKPDMIGRSHGFFVYVYDRLINIDDDHFGIPPNELKHGVFGRFRLVIYMDGLDDELRSNRESISDGPMLETAKNILRAIFNAVRIEIERHMREEEPGAKLTRSMASSSSSMSRRPIIDLVRRIMDGKTSARYLIVPNDLSKRERDEFLHELEKRAQQAEDFFTGVEHSAGSPNDGIAKFDTVKGVLRLNESHPFVAVFHDEFTKGSGRPLELLAMAEVLLEAHLYSIDVVQTKIDEFLSTRDQILRDMANESGHKSAMSVANALSEARNNSTKLEECVCDAFLFLGFDVEIRGGPGKADGVATAHLPADDSGKPQKYKVCLEAKSKIDPDRKVAAKDVNIGAVARHSKNDKCEHAIVVGPAFPTSGGNKSALAKEIKARQKPNDYPKTITLINVDDLAELVKLRPKKQIGLKKMRGLFEKCVLPEESSDWVECIRKTKVRSHPYRQIVETIEKLQIKFKKAAVTYSSLRIELSHLRPPIIYETDREIAEICKLMKLMVPRYIWARKERVELEQSAKNIITEIKNFQELVK